MRRRQALRAPRRGGGRSRHEARSGVMFIATMGHELREPLNGVLGMARLLRDTHLDDEQQGYVDTLLASGEVLLGLISDVIDLSRLDAGRLDLLETTIDLRAFLERFLLPVRAQAQRKGLRIDLDVADTAPRAIRVDPGRLRQILTNLLGNAIKFTEEGGVTVTAAAGAVVDGRAPLRLQVADTGPGIPEEARRDLFQAFVQAGPTVRRLYGGSGLGLVIAGRLAEALGGAITLKSGPAGTTFTLDLPVEVATPAATEREHAALAGASLLVVDPQQRTRETMIALAQGWGILARGARSNGQALALLEDAADRGAAFDIVAVDHSLSDGSGGHLAERIRGDPRLADARLVLLASAGLRGDAARARAAGFAAYLPKPVGAAAMLDCLKRLRAPGAGDGAPLITIHSLVEERPPPLRVLVVDDNAVNCRILSVMLQRLGHEVNVVRDGADAIEAVLATPFDLVLMDVRMPGVDGLTATRRIRAVDDLKPSRVPIVAVTADAMQGDAERCRAAGMDGYVTKPVTVAGLQSALDIGAKRRTLEKIP